MMRQQLLFLIIILVLFVSCGDNENESTSNVLSTEQIAAEKEKYDILTDRVLSVIDTWLNAQNQGDFLAYQNLYSSQFLGIKRVGDEAFEYDQEDWLEDRRGMFANPMTVQAENVQVSFPQGSIEVNLVQSWESGFYKDRGNKKILMEERNDTLNISYEEMIDSAILSSISEMDSLPRVSFLLNDQYMILDYNIDTEFIRDLDQSSTQIESGSGGLFFSVTEIPAKKLPSRVTSKFGNELFVYDDEGNSHEAVIKDAVAIVGQWPHFGMIQQWNQLPQEERNKDILERLWNDNTGGSAWFVAYRLEDHRLKNAYWAGTVDPSNITYFDLGPGKIRFEQIPGGMEENPYGDQIEYTTSNITIGDEIRYVYEIIHEPGPCGGGASRTIYDYESGEVFLRPGEMGILLDLNNNGILDLIIQHWNATFSYYEDGELKTRLGFPYYDCGC